MLYIEKSSPSKQIAEKIRQVKSDVNWSNTGPVTPEQARSAFDQLDKNEIRARLVREQKGLCAYCMRRIKNDTHIVIEHWRPIDQDPKEALSYSNMMACCDGGSSNNSEIESKSLCCDASKKNTVISISPYNRSQMEKIRYNRKGYIYTYPEEEALETDINEILRLNGERDKEGNLIHDTSTQLVHGRRNVYENYERYIMGLTKKNKNLKAELLKRRNALTNRDEYKEYIGVWLYLIDRKLKRL